MLLRHITGQYVQCLVVDIIAKSPFELTHDAFLQRNGGNIFILMSKLRTRAFDMTTDVLSLPGLMEDH